MLHKSHISSIEIYSDAWHQLRIGKFTSSKIVALMGEKPFTTGAMTYIHQKSGEFITGQSVAEEDEIIEDENTVWGIQNEPIALNKFGVLKKIKYLVTQKVIHPPNGRVSSTPDALWIIDSSVIKEDCYNVATVEVKCPRKYHTFIPLFACSTPAELKRHSSKYYWQVIDQMLVCHAPVGYFVCYHPLFPEGSNLKVIQFLKIDLWNEFSLLEQRKEGAIQKSNDIISLFPKT